MDSTTRFEKRQWFQQVEKSYVDYNWRHRHPAYLVRWLKNSLRQYIHYVRYTILYIIKRWRI